MPIGRGDHLAMEQLLLTVTETAEAMRVSKRTAATLVSTGQLMSIRIGRLRRVPAAQVEAYINRGLVAASAEK